MATKSSRPRQPEVRKRIAILAAVLLHGEEAQGLRASEEEAAVVAAVVRRILRSRRALPH